MSFALHVTFHLIWNINSVLEDSGEGGVDGGAVESSLRLVRMEAALGEVPTKN